MGTLFQRNPLIVDACGPELEYLTSVMTGCENTQGVNSDCSPCELWQNKVSLGRGLGVKFSLGGKTLKLRVSRVTQCEIVSLYTVRERKVERQSFNA